MPRMPPAQLIALLSILVPATSRARPLFDERDHAIYAARPADMQARIAQIRAIQGQLPHRIRAPLSNTLNALGAWCGKAKHGALHLGDDHPLWKVKNTDQRLWVRTTATDGNGCVLHTALSDTQPAFPNRRYVEGRLEGIWRRMKRRRPPVDHTGQLAYAIEVAGASSADDIVSFHRVALRAHFSARGTPTIDRLELLSGTVRDKDHGARTSSSNVSPPKATEHALEARVKAIANDVRFMMAIDRRFVHYDSFDATRHVALHLRWSNKGWLIGRDHSTEGLGRDALSCCVCDDQWHLTRRGRERHLTDQGDRADRLEKAECRATALMNNRTTSRD